MDAEFRRSCWRALFCGLPTVIHVAERIQTRSAHDNRWYHVGATHRSMNWG